ncbi:protein FAM13A-like isoform X2 [Dysidea avara]|uniref:protein FAM13A-like isoform X2 n=1 Tax=Dysidea avara TaxID=196820 RepID=UPI00331B84B8
MLSPLLCGSSGLDKVMEPIKSNSHLSRMRNMLAHSPLGRRRHSSSGSITSSNESPLTSPVGRVWGISLELLVKQTTKEVPFIVEKIIEHIEQCGLDQEGLYRVNGNARTIEKLKASFDKVGDADFCDVDVAAIGGLLKLFLRDMPVPLITESVASQFVQLHEDVKSYTGQQYYEKIRSLVKQLPLHHYHLLRYLVRHLVCVAKHEEENKMSPVSLSIVFGPNIFRCDAGLAGLQKQGVCNSFLSKMIMKCDQVFMQDDEVWIAQVKEEAQQRRQKPQKPVPYSVYMENLNSLEELDDDDRSHDVLSSSWGHSPTHITKSSTTSPAHITKTSTSSKSSTNERNVDDWVTASYPGGSQSPLNRSHDSDPDLGNGRFVREVGIRRRSSIDGVRRKTSLSPPREEELPRTPSPWSQCSNSPISPNSSPVQGTSQVMSQFLSTVIQQTVRELLFGPSGSHGTSTPAKPVSLARQRRRNTPGTRGGGSTANDVTNTNTATDDKNTKGDMTSSVTSHGGDTTDSSKTHPVILRRGSSKEEKEKKKINRESGALFSEQFKVATGHSSVDEIDGVEQSEVTNKLKHHKKHKPVVKGFDLFESSGLIMGAPIMAKPTVVMPNSQEHHHFVMTSSESHDEEDTLSQSTGLYDVKMVKSSLQPLPVASDDLDVVKSIETLSHPTLGRPRPPANRRSPGRRGHGVDTNSVPDKKHTLLSSSDELNNIPATQLGHNVLSVTLHSKTDATLQTISSDNVQSNNLQTKSSDNLQSKSSDSLHTQSSNTLQAKSSDETKSSDNFQAKSSDKLPTKSSKNIQPKSSNNLQAKAKSSDKRTKPSDTFKSVGELHTKTSSVIYSKTIGSDHLSLTATAAAGSPTHRRLHDVASPTHTGLHDVDSRTHNNGPHNTGSSTHNRSHDVASSTHTRLHDVGSPTHNRPHDASSSIRSRSHDVGSPTHRKSHDASPTHSTSLDDQQRRLKELKNEVRRFEADYMAQHGGNKPSGADKDPIRPLMREYFTIKHQLQSSSEMLSKTAPAKLITKGEPDIHRDEHTDRHTDGLTVGHMDLCTALEKCQKLLADNRRKAGRPDSLDHMSLEQLREEKLSVQKTLIEFENEHGRPETEEGKEMMRPIYDYYRQLKKLLGGRRGSTRSKSQGAELALTTVSMLTAQDASDVSQLPPNVSCGTTVSPPHTRESVSSVESYKQVKEKLDNALAEKHNLKQLIRKCEEDFLQEHGRAVMEKEDRQPLQQHYTAYKRIKAHIKLLQTILTKKDSNITV